MARFLVRNTVTFLQIENHTYNACLSLPRNLVSLIRKFTVSKSVATKKHNSQKFLTIDQQPIRSLCPNLRTRMVEPLFRGHRRDQGKCPQTEVSSEQRLD